MSSSINYRQYISSRAHKATTTPLKEQDTNTKSRPLFCRDLLGLLHFLIKGVLRNNHEVFFRIQSRTRGVHDDR